ncbi:hypothetical protein ACPW96_11920 [Micromonospora sp. DT81.3]|uniref:hypothetical protein n=1 Tax=Micromonospora sp. DT81.3 TaxID=3416523 RepID=UPI003CEB88E2
MIVLSRVRQFIRGRGELLASIPLDDLRRAYWEQLSLAEAAAFDGYFATSRTHHRSAAHHLRELDRRGETALPAHPTSDRTSSPETA